MLRRVVMAMMYLISVQAGCIPESARADAFSLEGDINAGVEHDNNVSLVSDNKLSSLQYSTSLSGDWSWHRDAFIWDVRPRVQVLRYRDTPLYDRNNGYLTSTATWYGERSNYAIQLDGVQDSTLSSEAGTTGVTQINKRHRTGTATLNTSLQMTERTSVVSQVSYMVSRYQDAAQFNLVDYTYASASSTLQRALSERLVLTAGASYGKLHVRNQPGMGKYNIGGTLGLQYTLTDRSSVNLSAGPSRVRTQTSSQSGLVYSAQYQWKRELENFSLNLSRSITPTGFGALSRQDSLDMNWYQPISERWFSSISLSGMRNRYVQQRVQLVCDPRFIQFGFCFPVPGIVDAPIDIKYGVLTATLGWHVTPTIDVRLSVSEASQKINVQTGRADRQHVALTVNWNGLAHVLH